MQYDISGGIKIKTVFKIFSVISSKKEGKEMKKFIKKLLAVSLALAMTLCVCITAYGGSSKNNRIVYDNDDFLIEKISHPNRGSGEVDGIVDYAGNGVVTVDPENGEGDRGQSYSWAAIAYNDWVYIGTCYGALTNTISLVDSKLGYHFSPEVMNSALDALYNGHFYTGEPDGGSSKGILVKINVNTSEVVVLMSYSETGSNCAFRNAVEYNGMLYFCGSVNVAPSVYEINPETDEFKLVYSGITIQEYIEAYQMGLSVGIRGICVHNNKLVISCMGLEGAFIATSDHPSDGQEAFDIIADMDDLFGYPAYHYWDSIYGGSIWDMISYNGKLYVSICTGTPDNKPDENSMQSFAIVVGEENADGTYSWRVLAGDTEKDNARYTFGIDPERTRSGAANLIVYNDYLYIGEYNDEEIALIDIAFKRSFDFMNANLEQSVNLYRMDKDENIELVVGDADNMFPEGSLSGLESGFGRNENQYIWKMCVYEGKLFVGTMDTSSLLEPFGQFSNGDLLGYTKEEWRSQVNYLLTFLRILIAESGSSDEEEGKSFTSEASDYLTKAPSNFAKMVNNASVNGEKLSKDDIKKLAKLLSENDFTNSKELFENANDYNDLIAKLNELIEQFMGSLNEKDYEAFSKLYELAATLYNSIVDRITGDGAGSENGSEYETILEQIQAIYEQMLGFDAQKFINGFITNITYMKDATRGFDLYVSEDGINFETITINGFNDPYNHGLRTTAVTDSGLAIGTANPFYGTQVWKLFDEHEPVRVDRQEPTCTDDGHCEYYVCKNCGRMFADAECKEPIDDAMLLLSAKGHSTELVGAVEPTATEPGYTGDLVCTECGEMVEKGKEIPPTGDTPDTPDNPDTPEPSYMPSNPSESADIPNETPDVSSQNSESTNSGDVNTNPPTTGDMSYSSIALITIVIIGIAGLGLTFSKKKA